MPIALIVFVQMSVRMGGRPDFSNTPYNEIIFIASSLKAVMLLEFSKNQFLKN
jgi:hypothetical protein